jgi:transmembrane sensor
MEEKKIGGPAMDELLVQYIIGPVSAIDKARVEKWLNESSVHQDYFNNFRDIYLLGKITAKPAPFNKEQSLERVKSRYYRLKSDQEPKTTNIRKLVKVLYIAAAFIIALGLGFCLRAVTVKSETTPKPVARVYNEITSPKGSRSKIVLPDGTTVWLNAGSTIKYPMNFLTHDREVHLTGEAYFEVAKMHNKRFIVNASDIAIKVWGTKFNVKAYPEEKTIETTLVEGSVSIQKLRGKVKEKETYLAPNQTAVFYKAEDDRKIAVHDNTFEKVVPKSKVLIREKVNTILYTSWKDEKWVVEGQQLGDLAKELERRYNVNIVFDNNSIKDYRFTGTFTNETFEQLLEIIQISAPIDFSITNNTVLLKENSSSKKKYDEFLTR